MPPTCKRINRGKALQTKKKVDPIQKKLASIKLLLLDVDGVLTQGDVVYDDDGRQIKTFNVKDGLGLRLLKAAGIEAGVVTGRRSEALYHRCKDLDITLIFDHIKDKVAVLEELRQKGPYHPENIAYVGDDLPDLPIMKRVGLAVAVADACEPVRGCADIITGAPGGGGAVREICEQILKSQGHWEKSLKYFE